MEIASFLGKTAHKTKQTKKNWYLSLQLLFANFNQIDYCLAYKQLRANF